MRVPSSEILIRKLGSIDGFSAGAIAASEVSALTHEIRDDAMECGPFEMQWLTTNSNSFLAGAQSSEVLGGFRSGVGEELHHNAPTFRLPDQYVEENLWILHSVSSKTI